MIEAVVVETVRETASALESVAQTSGLITVNERDDLQPVLATRARIVAARVAPTIHVTTQRGVEIEDWPGLGNIDVAFESEATPPALVELKCGASADALGPCVWDATKLAFALARKRASAAYLIAGAPVSRWDQPIRGCEFLGDGSWELSALRGSFADWWRSWERRGDPQPSRLPAAFDTTAVACFPFRVGRTAWELRVSAVTVEREDWLPWPSML